jgi:hypothetical protein
MAMPKKPDGSQAIGRPSLMDEPKYKAEICAKVIEFGKAGKSETQIAVLIDVPRATMFRWAEQHEDFRAALERAKDYERHWWEEKGQDNLENRDFNASLWKMQIGARFRDDYGDPKPRDTDAEAAINNALLKSYSNNAAALIAALLEAQRRSGNPVDMGELIALSGGNGSANGIKRPNGNGKA